LRERCSVVVVVVGPVTPPGASVAHVSRGARFEHPLGVDRVVPAGTPRVAPEQAPRGKRRAPQYAVLSNGLCRVPGARRLVPAPARKAGRDRALIDDDRGADQPPSNPDGQRRSRAGGPRAVGGGAGRHGRGSPFSAGAFRARRPARSSNSPSADPTPSRPSRSASSPTGGRATSTTSWPPLNSSSIP
jgi:hypothetical protein